MLLLSIISRAIIPTNRHYKKDAAVQNYQSIVLNLTYSLGEHEMFFLKTLVK